MKLPRDLNGQELSRLLRRYGYEVIRQSGSHIRLTSRLNVTEHHITIPLHTSLKVGTLAGILGDVAAYLEIDRETLAEELFG